MNKILGDRDTYVKLLGNPTPKLKKKLEEWLKKGTKKGILDKKEAKYLNLRAPKIPLMYQLLKIHKNKTTPPGRPIISGIHSLCSRTGEYLDTFFQPLAAKGPAFLRDGKDLKKLLQEICVEGSTLLVTADVESLYTNIKQNDALDAVKWSLHKYTSLKQDQNCIFD